MERSWSYVFEFLWEPCVDIYPDNVDTLNICIKKFDALILFFDKMAAS